MVDKAGVGGKNEYVRNDLVMKQTKQYNGLCVTQHGSML